MFGGMRMSNLRIKPVERVALCGLLTSLMLILGYFESMLPALPGVVGAKLGLANSVLLYALYKVGTGTSFVLMVLKVLLTSVLYGGVSAMLYSMAGGLLSLVCMALVKRIKGAGMVGVSMVGAVSHNAGQVLMAMLILQTTALLYYMAFLLLIGILTGLLTGTAAMQVFKHLGARGATAIGAQPKTAEAGDP